MTFTPAMANRIELWPLERLKPYAKNARTHSDAQVAQIAASIVEFGFTSPLLVSGTGDIMAGHGRLAAAKKLALEAVPVVVLDHLSETQRRAYILADNQLALQAGWDEELLAAELAELQNVGFDLALTGFDDAELAELLGPAAEEGEETGDETGDEGTEEGDEQLPEVPQRAVSRTGDVWQIGAHRLICGDATDPAVIAALMQGEAASLCFTSPPYGSQRDYASGGIGDWDVLMRGVFAHLPMAADGQVLVNLGLIHRDNEWLPYWSGWLDWMRQQGWRRFAWYVWDQGAGLPGDWAGRLAPCFEFVFHFNRQSRKPHKIVPCKTAGQMKSPNDRSGFRQKDGQLREWNGIGQPVQDFRMPDAVIRINRHTGAIGMDISHPAVFPVALPEHILLSYTDEGQTVFEPFNGSGTTLLAAQRTKRIGRSVEIAPQYVDVAIKRFRNHHPDIPVTLVATGQTFDELEQERLEHPDASLAR